MRTFQPGTRVLVSETVDRGRDRELIHHDGVVVVDPSNGGHTRVPVEVDLHNIDPSCRRGLMGIRFYKPGNLIAQPAVRVGPFVIDEDSGTQGSDSSYEELVDLEREARDAIEDAIINDGGHIGGDAAAFLRTILDATTPRAETYASVLRAENKALLGRFNGLRTVVEMVEHELRVGDSTRRWCADALAEALTDTTERHEPGVTALREQNDELLEALRALHDAADSLLRDACDRGEAYRPEGDDETGAKEGDMYDDYAALNAATDAARALLGEGA